MQANTIAVGLQLSMFLKSVSTSKNTEFLPAHISIFYKDYYEVLEAKMPSLKRHSIFLQRHSFQATFIHHVQQMTGSLAEMGNPFLEETKDLPVMRLETRDIIDSAVIPSVFQVEEQQYETFLKDLLLQQTTPISAPLFSQPSPKERS